MRPRAGSSICRNSEGAAVIRPNVAQLAWPRPTDQLRTQNCDQPINPALSQYRAELRLLRDQHTDAFDDNINDLEPSVYATHAPVHLSDCLLLLSIRVPRTSVAPALNVRSTFTVSPEYPPNQIIRFKDPFLEKFWYRRFCSASFCQYLPAANRPIFFMAKSSRRTVRNFCSRSSMVPC